jgi:hypothetical protein
MPERRRLPRQQTSRAVFIKSQLLPGGKASLPCVVINISELGARLLVEDARHVPDRFTIALSERGVPRRRCRIVWRGDGEVGVSFEAEKYDSETWRRELAPGSTLDEALSVFALHPGKA